jgi:hypothetical protein
MGFVDLFMIERTGVCAGGSASPSLAGTWTVSSGGRFGPFDEEAVSVDGPAFWGDEWDWRGPASCRWTFTFPIGASTLTPDPIPLPQALGTPSEA